MVQERPIAVIGAGIVGLATAYALTERGAPVQVYESGVPGNGQSGGESRIFRHGHDDPRLARLARDGRALWTEWSERFGVELVSPDGVVAIGPSVGDRLRILQEIGGVPARPIESAELHDRLPLLAAYDGPAMVDEAGGAIRVSAAIRTLADQVRDALITDEVVSIRPTGRDTVEVRTGGDRREYASAVVCAGRGTVPLARHVGLSLPVRLSAHVRLTFAVSGPAPAQLACLRDTSGCFGEPGAYAAAEPGNRRYGVGLSQSVDVRSDGSLLDPVSLAALSDRTSDFVARALPGLDPDPVEFRHCWVTDLPWSEDGIGIWQSDRIFFVSGHNLFKHAPMLGTQLASAALGDGFTTELRPESRLGEPQR